MIGRRGRLAGLALSILALAGLGRPAYSCTDFLVRAADNTVVVARSMEFAVDLKSEIIVIPRGTSYASMVGDGKPGLAWSSKYAILALNQLGNANAVDGLNEAGLSMGGLWMPGTAYPAFDPQQAAKTVPIDLFGDWLLGNFATIDEVKAALKDIRVFGNVVPSLGIVPPIHLSLHDAAGKSLVIEFMKGEMQVYDNPVGVMTNAPEFSWHLTNLNNYTGLRPGNPAAVADGGVTFSALGQGGGWLGLPGGYSPPDRFVRMAVLKKAARQPDTAQSAMILADHLINNVDIARGTVREGDGAKAGDEYTQWVVVKDLTNKTLCVRTYEDPALRCVGLNKLDAASGPIRRAALSVKPTLIDLSPALAKPAP